MDKIRKGDKFISLNDPSTRGKILICGGRDTVELEDSVTKKLKPFTIIRIQNSENFYFPHEVRKVKPYTNPLKSVNFLTLALEFEELWKKEGDNLYNEYEHSLNKKEFKLLYYTDWLFKQLDILSLEDSNTPKEFKERNPFICLGGTCSHGKCPEIGKIVHCDTGCMYLGA